MLEIPDSTAEPGKVLASAQTVDKKKVMICALNKYQFCN